MKRFKNILYVNESEIDQDSALARAVALAQNNQANLTIVAVIPPQIFKTGIGLLPGQSITSKEQESIIANHRLTLESMLQPYKQGLDIQLKVLVGKTFLEVIRIVLKNNYDLVIKPAENPNWTQRLFSSDDLHLLRKCPCPIWIMKPPEKSNYSRIVAAVDFDPMNEAPNQNLNRKILEIAASLALSDFASLHIIHAWEAFAEKRILSRNVSSEIAAEYIKREHDYHQNWLNSLADDLIGWIGKDAYNYLSPSFDLTKGPAKKMIAQRVSDLVADLVVMGTVARTGIPGIIIGNTAETIIDQIACSVLAIKPDDFKTPIETN